MVTLLFLFLSLQQSRVCDTQRLHAGENTHYLFPWAWASFVKVMLFNSVHYSANDAILIFVGVCRLHTFFLSFVDGYLGCFHILTIVNNADINVNA